MKFAAKKDFDLD